MSRGDRLSTLYRDSLTTLREIPVQVTELDVGQDYSTPPLVAQFPTNTAVCSMSIVECLKEHCCFTRGSWPG